MNLHSLDAPADVRPEVRGAQYVGLLVGEFSFCSDSTSSCNDRVLSVILNLHIIFASLYLGILLEEEIPEAIQLLRTFSRDSLKQHKLSYKRFVFSALCRLVNGYLFIVALFFIIVQANYVLDIFYDLLALQFVQSIDDVCFALAKREMFGARLFLATNEDTRIIITRRDHCFAKSTPIKFVYLINLVIVYAGLIFVTVQQKNGTLMCQSIEVTFDNTMWEGAWYTPDHETYQTRNLEYAFFNGVYRFDGFFGGLPRYVEQNKRGDPFRSTLPAEIVYCQSMGRWVFRHKNIIKNKSTKFQDDEECMWLARSQETVEFDLTSVNSGWKFWTGIIEAGTIEMECSECQRDSDCHWQGVCLDKACQCDKAQGFTGMHCSHEPACSQLRDDYGNGFDLAKLEDTTFVSYERNIYFQTVRGNNSESWDMGWGQKPNNGNDNVGDKSGGDFFGNYSSSKTLALVYSGNRWFGVPQNTSTDVFWKFNEEFHSFWSEFFSESG